MHSQKADKQSGQGRDRGTRRARARAVVVALVAVAGLSAAMVGAVAVAQGAATPASQQASRTAQAGACAKLMDKAVRDTRVTKAGARISGRTCSSDGGRMYICLWREPGHVFLGCGYWYPSGR